MIFVLGNFEFEALNVDEFERSLEYGIVSNERIKNHPCYVSIKKENEKLTISGKTLPLKKDKNTYLDELKKMGSKNEAYALCGANGVYYGSFVIMGIEEKQSAFVDGSGFLIQSFELKLERDFDE